MHQTIYGTASCCALKMVSTSCRSSRSRTTSEARSASSPPCGDIAYRPTSPTLSTRRQRLNRYDRSTAANLAPRSLGRYDPASRRAERMNRRAFVTGLGAALAAPLGV
jgi:hypothetical protein